MKRPGLLYRKQTIGLVATVLLLAFSLSADERSRVTSAKPAATDDLFTNGPLPRIRIEIPPAALQILRAYNWEWGGNTEERTNVLVTVREGKTVYTNVALHLKGAAGSFRPIDSDRPALTLNFDKHAEGQRFHGLQKLHLNNSIQDRTYACEQLARELFNRAGVPAPRAAHAIAQINDREPTLYVLVEGWNKQFLKRHFKNNTGSLWDGGFGKDIDRPLELNSGPATNDHRRLKDLARISRESDTSLRWQELQSVLDVDRFLTFAALEIMFCHWDGYSMGHNNYRAYHDPDSDRVVFLPHGLDQLFGVFRSNPEARITPMMKGIAARGVTQTREGRRSYHQRMGSLLTNLFIAEKMTRRVDEIGARVRTALPENERAQYDAEVNSLKSRIERRVRSVTAQLAVAEQPLLFDADNKARLTGWESRQDSGNPSFGHSRGSEPTLQIFAAGSRAYGSWRTTVLLDAGAYQFTGRARVEDIQIGAGVTNGGITLRYSGERKAKMITSAPEWTTLTYDFSVAGLTDIELLCELRATRGRAWFDEASLKLIRKSGPVSEE